MKVQTQDRLTTQTWQSQPLSVEWCPLLTSSVISLCRVHTTFDLCKYKLKTDSQLKPDNASPSLLRYDPVNLWCYEFVWSLLYTTFDLCKYKLKTDSQLKPDNPNPSLLSYAPVNLWCYEFVYGVMSLCRVYYTQPLICGSTNNQLTKYSVAMMGEAAIHCFMSYSPTAHYCAVFLFFATTCGTRRMKCRSEEWDSQTVHLAFISKWRYFRPITVDEWDILDRITHAWTGFNYSLTQDSITASHKHRQHSSVLVREADS